METGGERSPKALADCFMGLEVVMIVTQLTECAAVLGDCSTLGTKR